MLGVLLALCGRRGGNRIGLTVVARIEHFHTVPATYFAARNAELFFSDPKAGLTMGATCQRTALAHPLFLLRKSTGRAVVNGAVFTHNPFPVAGIHCSRDAVPELLSVMGHRAVVICRDGVQ